MRNFSVHPNPRDLILNAAQYALIVDQALIGRPAEICGIIGGRGSLASQVIPLPNSSPFPMVRYQVDPRAFLAAYRNIETKNNGGELIGIYHSHPIGDPVPSPTDIAEATWPDVTYVIVGLRDPGSPQVAAWIIRQGQAISIPLRIVDATPESAR